MRERRRLWIVAFDLGRRLGWATNLPGQNQQWGLEVFNEFRPHRMAEFMRFIQDNKTWISKADMIVFETPFARGRAATRSLWGMAGVLEAGASDLGLPCTDVAVPTIKKFASENGKAPKNEMIRCARNLGYDGWNDNEADAYCLLKYAEANLERVSE